MMEAVENGNVEEVKIWLQRAPEQLAERFGDFGLQPIHEAARTGSRDLVQLLIDYGADINARDGY